MTEKEKQDLPAASEEENKVVYRQEKVATLKAAVEAGTYKIDPEAIAASIIRDLAAAELQRRRQAKASAREADLPEGLEVSHPDLGQAGPEEEA